MNCWKSRDSVPAGAGKEEEEAKIRKEERDKQAATGISAGSGLSAAATGGRQAHTAETYPETTT